MIPISPPLSASERLAVPSPTPADPEAAAAQFEAVLVRQFVEVMTKDLFDGEGEGMLTGQADLQRDTLTDALTDHLVDAGTLGIADLLVAQWERVGRVPASEPRPDAGPPPNPPRLTPTPGDAVRRHPPQQ